MALGESLSPSSQTLPKTGSRRPTWRLGGSGGPGPRSTSQPGTGGAAPPVALERGEGLGTGPAAPATRAGVAPPRQPAPRDPACPRPRHPTRSSPRQVSHLRAEETPAAREGQAPLRARPPVCVRGPESRARLRTVQSRARLPRLHSGRGRVPEVLSRDGESSTQPLPRRHRSLTCCHFSSDAGIPVPCSKAAQAGSVWIFS